ncbi:MAG: hypothetical protein NW223_04590 [Hyphomicrobiaceae bacterium]|nr:hypothetical protein [Hyphomicrobiaceae bacterium]
MSTEPGEASERTPLRNRGSAMILGGLGLLSGLASALAGDQLGYRALQPLASLFLLHVSLLPIGVFYAAAITAGVWLMARRPVALVAFPVTLYAWSGAVHTAIRSQRHVDDDAHLIAASLAAGAVGAGLTQLGAALGLPRLRRWRALAATTIVGAAFGLLFYAGERGLIDKRVLFAVWQPAVALAIGLSAAAPTSARQ